MARSASGTQGRLKRGIFESVILALPSFFTRFGRGFFGEFGAWGERATRRCLGAGAVSLSESAHGGVCARAGGSADAVKVHALHARERARR